MASVYLLDTSALRALSARDFTDLEAVKLSVGLSTLFETLAGMPRVGSPGAEAEFRSRRNAVRHWQRWITPARTFWLTPAQMRVRAFGRVESDNNTGFREVLRIAADTETLEELEARVGDLSSRSRRVPSLDFLREQRKRLHADFARLLKQGVEQVKRVTIAELGTRGYEDLRTARRMEREFRVFQTESGDTARFTLLALAEQAGVWDGQLPDSDLYEAVLDIEKRIREVYDGSVDPYIHAYSAHLTACALRGGDARAGDSLDLDQFVYVQPTGEQILITEDKALRELATIVIPGRAISVDELRHR
jgi:hypothetical protein